MQAIIIVNTFNNELFFHFGIFILIKLWTLEVINIQEFFNFSNQGKSDIKIFLKKFNFLDFTFFTVNRESLLTLN